MDLFQTTRPLFGPGFYGEMNMKICLAAMVAAAILPTIAGAQDATGQELTFTYGIGAVGLSGVYVGPDD
jgi:hypothetical protein